MKNRVFFYSSVKDKTLFETQKFYKTDIDLLIEEGYSVKVTNSIFNFFCFWKYDCAFIYFYRYGFFVALVARLFFKRVIFTGGIDDLDKNYASKSRYQIQKIFFKLCYFLSSRCLIVSNADLNNIYAIYRKDRSFNKISLSYHSIDVEKYIYINYPKKEELFLTIAWMGNLNNVLRKGLDKSLEAFKHLKNNYPYFSNYKFLIIGREGEGAIYLKDMCKKLDIENDVIFLGEIDEESKIDYLKRSKVYFQLSQYEGFGIAALEALSSHNVVVHSGKGGLVDSVGDFGVLYDINETPEVQIVELYKNLRRKFTSTFDYSDSYIRERYSHCNRKKIFIDVIG